ncbi:MAG: protein arginine kinase [Planctomycetota bacterium]|jgi:protein arginine kinase|nr:protein arginine kinase [Planctomycetota bacterium]
MNQSGEWLRGAGPDSDIVISSRVRLARNLERFPFLTRASDEQRTEIHESIRDALNRKGLAQNGHCYVDLAVEASDITNRFLLERHLISRELANGTGGRGVLFNRSEMLSVMVNEEDHLRLQAIRAGFQIEEAYAEVRAIDERLDRTLKFAYSDEFGYLTACPTNVGTGMRASVMFHLPALVFTKQVDKVFAGVTKINLAVRGFYGEGTQASGDFFQISNQITLGVSEEEILAVLTRIVPKIVTYEREVRDHLLDKDRLRLEDKIWRAYGTLQVARTITSEETMDLLSAVRLGVNLGLLANLDISTVNELFILTQPAHLQKLEKRELDPGERDAMRADFIRRQLGI